MYAVHTSQEENSKLLKKEIEDIQNVICIMFPNMAVEAFTNSVCPLRTPLQCSPHHFLHSEQSKEEMTNQLKKLFIELDTFNKSLVMQNEQLNILDTFPSVKTLMNYEKKETKNQDVKARLKRIILLISGVQENSDKLSKKLDGMNKELERVFSITESVVVNEIINFHNRLFAELIEFLKNRKIIEQTLHDKQVKDELQEHQMRQKFYTEVQQFIQNEVSSFKEMCQLFRPLIEDYTEDEEDKIEQFNKLNELEDGSKILIEVFRLEMNMTTTHSPILNSNIVKMRNWILSYEKFCIYMCQYWSISLSNPKVIKSKNSSGSSYCGLLQIRPFIVEFYTSQMPEQIEKLNKVKNESTQLLNSYKNLENQKKTIQNKIDIELKSPDLHREYEKFSESSKSGEKGLRMQSDKFLYGSEKVKLHSSLSHIREEQKLLLYQLTILKPKFDQYTELGSNLNILITKVNQMNQKDYSKQWNEFVAQEEKLCDNWKHCFYDYSTIYLNFRADTRLLLYRMVEKSERALAFQLNQEFAKLLMNSSKALITIKLETEAFGQVNTENMKCIDDFRLEIGNVMRSYPMQDLLVEIQNVVGPMQDYLSQKASQNLIENSICTQKCLLMVVESAKITMKKLFNTSTSKDNKAPISLTVQYLKVLDTLCCSDNSSKLTPLPLPTADCNAVNTSTTWIQLSEYPERFPMKSNVFNNEQKESEELVEYEAENTEEE